MLSRRVFPIIIILICAGNFIAQVHQQPMQEPLYPEAGDDITLSSEISSLIDIQSVSLFERIQTINNAGIVTSETPESLLHTWTPRSNQTALTAEHVKSGGYPANSVVTYRFQVTTNSGTNSRAVTFAVRPYPVADFPIPVYCQGSPDDVVDIVLIPHTDIPSLGELQEHSRDIIIKTLHQVPIMDTFNMAFNFYLNPEWGTATDLSDCQSSLGFCHEYPSNYENISFADGLAILHKSNMTDYSWIDFRLYSSELTSPNPFIHETGHAIFGLYDEYNGGLHQQISPFANNWVSHRQAVDAAPIYNMNSSNVNSLQDSWFTLCSGCIMKTWDLKSFDSPCSMRIIHVLNNIVSQ